MSSSRHRWLAGAVLVGLGWLVSPHPVPVYDGVGTPDEPYRYVRSPEGATATQPPGTAEVSTPVKDGRSTNGLSVTTREKGPQFSLFLPPLAMAAAVGPIVVRAEPSAPMGDPPGAKIDGNVYTVTMTASSGPVTLTDRSAISTVYLRATTAKQPPPALYHRGTTAEPWVKLTTSRGGTDFYVAAFPGPGQFAVAFASTPVGGGPPLLPLVLVGVLVLGVVVVLVVRLRATPE